MSLPVTRFLAALISTVVLDHRTGSLKIAKNINVKQTFITFSLKYCLSHPSPFCQFMNGTPPWLYERKGVFLSLNSPDFD